MGRRAELAAAWDDADVLFDGFGSDPVRQVVYAGDVNGDGWTDMFFSDPAYGGSEGRAELRY